MLGRDWSVNSAGWGGGPSEELPTRSGWVWCVGGGGGKDSTRVLIGQMQL